MGDCFILGAGFSRAVGGPTMPLTRDLADNIVPSFIEPLDGYRHILEGGKLPISDVEAWLSSLAEPQPYRDQADNLQAQALFLEIVRQLASDLRWRTNDVLAVTETPPRWFSELVHAWHGRKATVITFNYDTLIESTLPALNLTVDTNGAEEQLSYHRLPPGLLPHWQVMFDGLRLRPASTFRLLKLHGSLNWYWDPQGTRPPVDVGIDQVWGEDHPPDEAELRYRAPGLEPFLVPPTTGKSSYLGEAVLRETWRLAHHALKEATAVYSLGYSFPLADLSTRAMLASSVKDKTVMVVNVSGSAGERLRELVPGIQVDTTFCLGEDPIQQFVESYVNQT